MWVGGDAGGWVDVFKRDRTDFKHTDPLRHHPILYYNILRLCVVHVHKALLSTTTNKKQYRSTPTSPYFIL